MASEPRLSIEAVSPQALSKAQSLTERCQAPLASDKPTPVVMKVDVDDAWLERTTSPIVSWHIDFLSTEYQSKQSQRGKQDPLSRAIGLHKKNDLRVLDMSGGLGKDSFWLACLGASVTVVEKHPALTYLLQQAVDQLKKHAEWQAVGARMTVVHAQAQDYLAQVKPDQFDVAYYDPMFDSRKKTALVKKDMQILQALLGEGESAEPALIEQAKAHIPKVVVKRAKTDAPLRTDVHHQIETKVTRFDVY